MTDYTNQDSIQNPHHNGGEKMKIKKQDVVDAKQRLEGEDQELFQNYISHLASHSKDEATKKGKPDQHKVKNVLDKAFPDKDVMFDGRA